MASNHTFMNYNISGLRTHNFKPASLVSLSAHSYQQWAEPIFHSLLSTHHLIGTCFLTTESDKRMRLLTRQYGSSKNLSMHSAMQFRQQLLL